MSGIKQRLGGSVSGPKMVMAENVVLYTLEIESKLRKCMKTEMSRRNRWVLFREARRRK